MAEMRYMKLKISMIDLIIQFQKRPTNYYNFYKSNLINISIINLMTDNKQKKENVKMHLKDLRLDLKKIHLAVTEELLLPEPDEVKTLMYKMDQLLKVIESN